MRSGTSFFDWTLFKKNITRYWPLWAVYLIFWVFVLPLNILAGNFSADEPMLSALHGAMDMGLVAAVLYGPVCAMAVLSHLYNSRSANFFGSLPARREGIFLTQYTAGLAFSLAPDLLIALLTLGAAALQGWGRLDAILLWLAAVCVECFFFYTLAVICGLLTGHILALPCFYAASNVAAMALYSMVTETAQRYYWGWPSAGDGFFAKLISWLTPAEKLSQVTWQAPIVDANGVTQVERFASSWDQWSILAVYVFAGLLLALGAFLLYRRRRLETAGDVVAVSPLRPVFKYLTAIYTGLLLGFVTAEILGEDAQMFTTILWGVVGYFAAQMLLDKSFRVFKRWKGALAVAAVFGVFFAVMIFDLTGYETRIPDLEDVKSLEVTQFTSTYSLGDSGDDGGFTLTDPEEIAPFLALHRIGIDRRDNPHPEYVDDYDLYTYQVGSVFLTLTYHTTHGDISRSFNVSVFPWELDTPGSSAQVLESIFEDRDLYWRIYGLDTFFAYLEAGGRVDEMMYDYRSYYGDWNGETYSEEFLETCPEAAYEYFRYGNDLFFYDQSHITALLEALREDWENGRIGARRVENMVEATEEERSLVIGWNQSEENYLHSSYILYNNPYLAITIQPQATETLRVLYQLLPEVMEAQGLK